MGIIPFKNPIVVFSHGKLLLFGEYLALHGFSAVGVPLPFLRMTAKYIFSNSPLVIESEYSIPPTFYKKLEQISKEHNFLPLTGSIYLQSKIPISSGLGSSAAFCVCIAKIIVSIRFSTQLEDKYQKSIWNIAHSLEHVFHHTASGIDTALCTYNVPMLLQKSSNKILDTPSHFEIMPINIFMDSCIVFAVVPREEQAMTHIPHIYNFLKKYLDDAELSNTSELYRKWIESHSQAISLILQRGDVKKDVFLSLLANYASTIHSTLSLLELGNGFIDEILESANDIALGGKISGAGKGGAFYCICARSQDAQILKTRLSKLYEGIIFRII